jgi:hypothetical protein
MDPDDLKLETISKLFDMKKFQENWILVQILI